jgi:hypothetical protein
MKSTTTMLKFSLIALCVGMAVFFCSIAVAFAIGNYLDSYPYGFNCRGSLCFLYNHIVFYETKSLKANFRKILRNIFND